MNLQEIIKNFTIEGEMLTFSENKRGLINKTYVVTTSAKRYVCQCINQHTFKDPPRLMSNIEKVTSYLLTKNVPTLKLVYTKQGKSYVLYQDFFYRMYEYLEETIVYDQCESKELAYELGLAIANFHQALLDFPAENLYDSIPDFHYPIKRYNRLAEVANKATSERLSICVPLLEVLKPYQLLFTTIQTAIDTGKIPLRVAHNDTKLNNVLFCQKTLHSLCLIDFDTIMKGSWLYDYADALRICASTTSEDENDYSKIAFSIPYYIYFNIGYLSQMAPILTTEECNWLARSIMIITLELAMRFLTDYLEGDHYFKIDYAEHNLVRAKNQLCLAKSIEKQLPLLEKIVYDLLKRFRTI